MLLTDMLDPVASAAALAGLAGLVPRHLALCVLMNDAAIGDALDGERTGADPEAALRATVAMTLLEERTAALARLRERGIGVVDVPAARLTAASLDAYLEIKTRGLP